MARAWAVVVGVLLVLLVACSGGGGPAADDDLFGTTQAPSAPSASSGSPSTSSPGGDGEAGDGEAGDGEAGYGEPVLAGHLGDPALVETSGLVASSLSSVRLWAHNDSGDDALLYCLDLAGVSCGTWTVTGAEAIDWEDMARGPGPEAGVIYLYVGDIGDNARSRAELVVYRVPEPDVAGSAVVGTNDTRAADQIRLAYPDGAHDAEALIVHPASGDLYVVTKDPGAAGVYRAPAPHATSARVTMERVAVLAVGRDTIDPRSSLVTAADVSADGARVVLATYGLAYELVLPAGSASFDDIWTEPLRPVRLGQLMQGEAVAYTVDGRSIVSTSEGGSAPLFVVERL